jgi:hypothetical protein
MSALKFSDEVDKGNFAFGKLDCKDKRCSDFIVASMLGYSLPMVFFAEDDIDGFTLTTNSWFLKGLYDFIKCDEKLSFSEGVLKVVGERVGAFESKTFKQLGRPFQRRLEETEIVINIIDVNPATEQAIFFTEALKSI